MKESERLFYWSQYQECRRRGKTVTQIPVSGIGALLMEARDLVEAERQRMFEEVLSAVYGGVPRKPPEYNPDDWEAMLERIELCRQMVRGDV